MAGDDRGPGGRSTRLSALGLRWLAKSYQDTAPARPRELAARALPGALDVPGLPDFGLPSAGLARCGFAVLARPVFLFPVLGPPVGTCPGGKLSALRHPRTAVCLACPLRLCSPSAQCLPVSCLWASSRPLSRRQAFRPPAYADFRLQGLPTAALQSLRVLSSCILSSGVRSAPVPAASFPPSGIDGRPSAGLAHRGFSVLARPVFLFPVFGPPVGTCPGGKFSALRHPLAGRPGGACFSPRRAVRGAGALPQGQLPAWRRRRTRPPLRTVSAPACPDAGQALPRRRGGLRWFPP